MSNRLIKEAKNKGRQVWPGFITNKTTAKIWLWRLLLVFGLPLWVFPIFLLGGFVWLEATENKCMSTTLALLLGGMLGWLIIYILVTEGFQPAPSL